MATSRRSAGFPSSHLRKVSNGSSIATNPSRPTTSGAASTISTPSKTASQIEKRCMLWTHDESFSKDEVVLNPQLFKPGTIKPGELMAMCPVKSDSSAYQDQQASNEPSFQGLPKKEPPPSQVPRGDVNDSDPRNDDEAPNRYFFHYKDVSRDVKAKNAKLEVSMARHVAEAFGLKNRDMVVITTASNVLVTASHVELSFRDESLSRADMWRLVLSELSEKTVYKGQKVMFMGTIKAQVTSVFVDGRQAPSAFFSSNTKPIFRSESARFVIFIQMSREMWDFDSEGSGEIIFSKVVNGFLPALFKKWEAKKAKHLVTIVLFARVEYETSLATAEMGGSVLDTAYHTGIQPEGHRKPFKDFYRVVVSEMSSGEWTAILYQLKVEFRGFRRDISMHRLDTMKPLARNIPAPHLGDHNMGSVPGTTIEATPSLAMHGNVLEAINLATTVFSPDYIGRDLVRTGISIIVITPGNGLFEVDYNTLKTTTETLIKIGIGIDLVCLPKMPLHSVPLFRYRNPEYGNFDYSVRPKLNLSEESTPRQGGMFGSFQTPKSSLSPTKSSGNELQHRANRRPNEWSYAIPHWIDVSYWTGTTQDIQSRPGAQSSFYNTRVTLYQPNSFEIRCKLTELEMASLAENRKQVDVEPLVNDPTFPRTLLGVRENLPIMSSVNFLPGRKPHGGLSGLSWPTTRLHDRQLSQAEREFYKALDSCDVAWSKPLKARKKPARLEDGNLASSSENAIRETIEEDSSIYGTSYSTEKGDYSGMSMTTTTGSSSRSRSEVASLVDHPRRDSMASNASKVTPTKPKIERKISLGFRGFGIAAPKAAVAAVMTDHATIAQIAGAPKSSQTSLPNAMASHLLSVSNMPRLQDRPPSSSGSQKSITAPEKVLTKELAKTTPTPPITVKSALQSLESTNLSKTKSILGSVYEGVEPSDDMDPHSFQKSRASDSQRLVHAKLRAGSTVELPPTLSPLTAMAPWLTVLNPTNPPTSDGVNAIIPHYKRWQHVYPRPHRVKSMKWKSLCTPASLPLTTEEFPSKYQLEIEYQQQPYNVSRDVDDSLAEEPLSRQEFLMELIALRLVQGFQVVVGPAVAEAFGQRTLKIANILDKNQNVEDGASVFMSMGHVIHQLSCVNGTEVEVNTFTRKPSTQITTRNHNLPSLYRPAIRSTLQHLYLTRHIHLSNFKDELNWNYIDSFIASHEEEMSEHLPSWKARYVLIPVDRPPHLRRHGEDDDEEVRLEGIRKLTQAWQRNRYVPPSERRFQPSGTRRSKDPKPLDITYRTQDPSVVIAAELETLPLLETGNPVNRRGLLSDWEPFRRSGLNISALADAIQAPVEEGGVRMQNRRWHLRFHYNCFIGSDMTTWILDNFEDIETREEAVELGNSLMVKNLDKLTPTENEKDTDREGGLFVHVERRHPFRDGQYFYQIAGEYAKQRPDTRGGWFGSRRRDQSVPSTPLSESMMRESPRPERSRSGSVTGDRSDSEATTPTLGPMGKRPRVQLSKMMRYNVDPRKRSYRPEKINLHYDRLHHPDNCYHIRIDWMNVTAKLIEDAVLSWAMTVEPYGLQLVEVPVAEACTIPEINHFRDAYIIKLALLPPDQSPETYFHTNSFAPVAHHTRQYYQKAILKKHGFVLDMEAARDLTNSNVDVAYSWGRPDYKHTQFIHRSGVLLAEITDDGNILLLANHFYNNRTASAREQARMEHINRSEHPMNNNLFLHGSDRATPLNSPALRPTTQVQIEAETTTTTTRASADVFTSLDVPSRCTSFNTLMHPVAIKNVIEDFCSSASKLEAFYKEVREKAVPVAATPNSIVALRSPGSDTNIPALGLPPNILAREATPSPMRLSGIWPSPAPTQQPLTFPPPSVRKGSVQSFEAWLTTSNANPTAERSNSSASGTGSQHSSNASEN